MSKTSKKVVKPVELTEEEKKAKEFVESAAQAIIDISKSIHALLNGKLNKRAIVLLIQEAAGGRSAYSKVQIEQILDCIAKLDKSFLK